MNFSQKLGLFALIVISLAYVYFSFFSQDFQFPVFKPSRVGEQQVFNPVENNQIQQENFETEKSVSQKQVKIFILDKSGNLRSVNRTCEGENSCFEYAIKELISAPTKWEKSKGFTSEIPQNTKILSIRESSDSVLIDLSPEFESGGGTESTYIRVMQIIKTAKANTNTPAYLYINGKQASVIGGEGLMIKQPLTERSLDE